MSADSASWSLDQFRKVFSTFCLITYYEQLFEFDEELFRRFIRKALKYHSINVEIDDVKNDICESANLLQKDGLKYIFIHRSFQEYFAAECAMQVVSGKAKDFLEVFARRSFDSVFSMCYEIHPELVFDQYFAKKIQTASKSPHLVPIGPKRKVNTWLCQSILIDCENSKRNGIRATRATYEASDEQRDFLRLADLCRQVASDEHWTPPIHRLFDAVVDSVNTARSSNALPRGDTQSLKIKLTFEGDKYSLSIRNAWERKF